MPRMAATKLLETEPRIRSPLMIAAMMMTTMAFLQSRLLLHTDNRLRLVHEETVMHRQQQRLVVAAEDPNIFPVHTTIHHPNIDWPMCIMPWIPDPQLCSNIILS